MIRKGMLSDHFEGVAIKKLSAVESSPVSSNQHEFNGTAALKRLFGEDDRKNLPARFIWLGADQECIASESLVSWYDARRKHPTRTEYRLYYPTNEVTGLMNADDVFLLAMKRDGTVVVVITPSDSTTLNQLLWLFGLDKPPEFEFETQAIEGKADTELDFTARYILDELGIELAESETDELDALVEPFGTEFPTTRIFSSLAQDSLQHISAASDNADKVLMAWLDREEMLFRRLERRIVSERLATGFMQRGEADVDGFIRFSLSVQNRRKSRAGQSLEHHLEKILIERGISYARGVATEYRHKPDFLFPSIQAYNDPKFPASKLRMLGAKSTLKDRWRQVLTEANRIPNKHLLTLEPAISEQQTTQMRQASLQLVVPDRIHTTFNYAQQKWLLNVEQFLELVTQQQK